ncbi:MAG: hypothetical protein AABX13_00770 [Nanoarchaeota archaeon]
MTVFTNVNKEALEKLARKGFTKELSKTIHEQLRLKKGYVSLILYTSGKLLVQGSPPEVKEMTKFLEKQGIGEKVKLEQFRKETGWIIGSDETLKGDTFGGLVVAAVRADDGIRKQLQELGVQDSKTLSDGEIIPLAEKIKKLVQCEIRSVLPEEYNHGGDGQKVTLLLNKLHQDAAQDLGKGLGKSTGKHVVDKFPGCVVGDIQEEKAESKYVEVAAASILARAAGLQQLNYLSALAGFEVPKGSTHVQLALLELKRRGLEFRKFVKLEFRNVQEFR